MQISSTDRIDYGWLYREGDYWWDKETKQSMPKSDIPRYGIGADGQVYRFEFLVPPDGEPERIPANDRVPAEMFYSSGEAVYQTGYHVDIDRIATGDVTEYEGTYGYEFSSYPETIDYPQLMNLGSLNDLFARPGLGCKILGLLNPGRYGPLPYLEGGAERVKKVTFAADFEEVSKPSGEGEPSEASAEDGEPGAGEPAAEGEGGLDAGTSAEDGEAGAEEPAAEGEGATTSGKYLAFNPTYVDGWFEGLFNLREINGFEHVDLSATKSMARMFAGCSQLAELDLSSLETAQCQDFAGMLDGCSSLERLSFGEGWTQAAADPVAGAGDAAAGGNAAGKATFPIEMVDGNGAVFQAGDVIPDGAAIYTPNRINIRAGSARLLSPGSYAMDADGFGAVERGEASLPDGVDARKLFVYEGGSLALADPLEIDYSGEALEPPACMEVDGRLLHAGEDYTVEYVGNVDCGRAQAIITGVNGYYGSLVCPFEIADRAAYAFVYGNGLMVLKSGSGRPSETVTNGASYEGMRALRWFDSDDLDKGTSVPWADCKDDVSRVVVDSSFGDVVPESARGWFDGFSRLTQVDGLENLNTEALADAGDMFRGCAALENLDLSSLDWTGVRCFDGMLDGCEALQSLTFGESWGNAADEAGQLLFPQQAFGVSPSYQRFDVGEPVPAGAATYRFAGIPIQNATEVSIEKPSYAYTGSAIRPPVEVDVGQVRLQEGIDYLVTYENDIWPGTARAVVTGIGSFTGSLIVPYTITGAVTKVGDRLTYRSGKAVFTFVVTAVGPGGLSTQGVSAKLVDVRVSKSSTTTLNIPSECTVNGVRVDVTAIGTKLSGNFKNVKTVVVGSKVVTIGARAFAKTPKVKKLLVKSARLKSVKNCLKGSKVKKVETRCWLSKKRRATYKKWFTTKAGKKGVRFVYG